MIVKNLPSTLHITLNPKVYAVAGPFNEPNECPIATAISMQYGIPSAQVAVSEDVWLYHTDSGIAKRYYDFVGDVHREEFVKFCRENKFTVEIILRERE